MPTHVVGLDVSTTHTGWVVLTRGPGALPSWRLSEKGTVNRKKPEREDTYAERVADAVFGALTVKPHFASGLYNSTLVVYEVNYAPMPTERRVGMLKVFRVIGRVLRALGVEGLERRADNTSKYNRSVRLSLKYHEALERLGPLTEHEADALAVADAWATDAFAEIVKAHEAARVRTKGDRK